MKLLRAGFVLACLVVTPLHAAPAEPRTEIPLAPGLTYLRWQRPGPVLAHVLRAELTESTLQVGAALGGAQVLELEPLTGIVRAASGRTVVGAINGGFGLGGDDPFRGAPIGLLIVDGELICDPWPTQRSAVLFPRTGGPRIEAVGLRGSATGADARPFRLNGLNRRRLPGELVLYTGRFHTATRQIEAGQQVVLSGVFQPGEVLRPNTAYKGAVDAVVDGRVNVEIPAGGVVLAGSGPAASWLKARELGEEIAFQLDLAPAVGDIASAVGAGPRLLREGRVSVEASAEQLEVRAATGRQPRSAIGFNDTTLFLVAVDGRAPGLSIGCDQAELAQLLVELGAREAMELDGGGATTLYARDRIINRPSDGRERGLANALLLFTTGALTSDALPEPLIAEAVPTPPTVPPVIPPVVPPTVPPTVPPVTPPAVPPTPPGRLVLEPKEINLTEGQSVEIQMLWKVGDEAPRPIVAGELTVAIEPEGLGALDANSRFVAGKPGSGLVKVTYNGQTQSIPITVRARPAAPSQPTPPAGATAVALPADPAVDPPGAGWAKPEAPDGERRLIDGFESDLHWRLRMAPAQVSGNLSTVKEPKFQGAASVKLRYDFGRGQGAPAAYAVFTDNAGGPVSIGWARAVSIYVFGDGKGAWLRGSFVDATGKVHVVTLAPEITWDHFWARCSAVIPAGIPRPITWQSFFIVKARAEVQSAGAIYLDQFEGIY